ncbi:MAG: FecR domain-containing protein [Proteobacteria bacterium]|nr:FecR domain-containing protein [Pseudomonadota bacterium]
MSEEFDKTDKTTDEERSLADLMKLAGERPEIPMGIESRVYHRVQEEWRTSTAEPNGEKAYKSVYKSWRRKTSRGSLLRWIVPVGVTAAAVLVVILTSPPVQDPVQPVATVSRVVGAGEFGTLYSKGMSVNAGDVISTGSGEGLSLLLARGESLRIDANTQIRIDDNDRFTLRRGRIYADTGIFVYRQGGLKIDTPFGQVRDVGTQFSVAASTEGLDVAVREGRVNIENQDDLYSARQGERLILRHGQDASVDRIDSHDDYWNWVADLAPDFDLQNKSLLDFLKWAARETGKELLFDSDESRMRAMRTDVHGSVVGLTPGEALEAILATTTVRYRIGEDRIVIER